MYNDDTLINQSTDQTASPQKKEERDILIEKEKEMKLAKKDGDRRSYGSYYKWIISLGLIFGGFVLFKKYYSK